MEINWNDVQQALSDVHLEMLITVGALGILFLLGIFIGIFGAWLYHRANRSQKQEISQHALLPTQPPVSPKTNQDTPTTEVWMKHQKSKSHIPAPLPLPFEQQETAPSEWWEWWANFWQGISTEFFGAVVTAIFLGMLVLVAEQYQSIQNHKAELILQMGSPNNDFAIEAIRQLRSLGWIEDGTLKGAALEDANLQHADLENANLQSADLERSNLQSANLREANLQSAYLEDANLQRVNLFRANLQDADLVIANLQWTDLAEANLQEANLFRANLEGAGLVDANLNNAVLDFANLQGADMGGATLEAAYMEEVNLQEANLEEANLQGADLSNAYLYRTNLLEANLQGANLNGAFLQDAELYYANLQNTDLRESNLQGAILLGANLKGARLELATFNEETVLPDAIHLQDENGHWLWDEDNKAIYDKYWTPETDMSRYTDRNHPDFWQPDWVKAQNE